MGMGTPQVRWRLMHQSGRVSSMPRMRLAPQRGHPLHRRRPTCRERLLRAARAVSSEMNHW